MIWPDTGFQRPDTKAARRFRVVTLERRSAQ